MGVIVTLIGLGAIAINTALEHSQISGQKLSAGDTATKVNDVAVNTTTSVTPKPSSEQGVMSISRIVDDPRNFRDVQPHSVGLQVVSKYPILQNAISEADKRFEEAQAAYKNVPAGATIQLAVQPNYTVKISADLARDIVSEPELKFSQLPTSYGHPDLKSYGTSIRVGNAVYSIGITYI